MKTIIIKGGPGSGHYGHRGRPGKRGGSAPSRWGKELRFAHTDREGIWDFIERAGWPFREHATTWHPSHHEEWLKQLEQEYPEWYAGKLYTANSGGLNSGLRNPPLDEDLQHLIPILDAYVQTLKMPEDVVLFRGVDERTPWLTQLPSLEGSVMRDPAYMSTSFLQHDPVELFTEFFEWEEGDPNLAGALFEILAREGQPAGLGSFLELEMILPRDTGLRILNVDTRDISLQELLVNPGTLNIEDYAGPQAYQKIPLYVVTAEIVRP